MSIKTAAQRVLGVRLSTFLSGKPRRPARDVFTEYYQSNFLGDEKSRSGPGSNESETKAVRERLPSLVRELGATTMLDIPCGDFHWMSEVDIGNVAYTGADIVGQMVERNNAEYASDKRTFKTLDLIKDDLGAHDLVMCRDCLFHLGLRDGVDAIANIKRSGSRYLLSTTHVSGTRNIDIETGGYRPINLTLWPFDLPPPLETIMERPNAGFGDTDKALGLWRIADL
jgi:hypothetical protein